MPNDRESPLFYIFQASTEAVRRLIKAAEVNLDIEELSLGRAIYSGAIKTRHIRKADGATLTNAEDPGFGIRADQIRDGQGEIAAQIVAGRLTVNTVDGVTHVLVDSESVDGVSYSVAFTFLAAPGGLFPYMVEKGIDGFTMALVDLGNNQIDCTSAPVDIDWILKMHP